MAALHRRSIVYNTGFLTLTNDIISGNTPTGATVGSSSFNGNKGGGIYSVGGSLTISNDSIINNIASGGVGSVNRGGGIYDIGGTVTSSNHLKQQYSRRRDWRD